MCYNFILCVWLWYIYESHVITILSVCMSVVALLIDTTARAVVYSSVVYAFFLFLTAKHLEHVQHEHRFSKLLAFISEG